MLFAYTGPIPFQAEWSLFDVTMTNYGFVQITS